MTTTTTVNNNTTIIVQPPLQQQQMNDSYYLLALLDVGSDNNDDDDDDDCVGVGVVDIEDVVGLEGTLQPSSLHQYRPLIENVEVNSFDHSLLKISFCLTLRETKDHTIFRDSH